VKSLKNQSVTIGAGAALFSSLFRAPLVTATVRLLRCL
jgi:hypothetical protein